MIDTDKEIKRLRELIEQVAYSEIPYSEIEHISGSIETRGFTVVETEHWDELLIAVGLLEREEE